MTLKSVYEDPSTSTRDPALLAKRAGTTVKSARAFLRDQASSQVAQLWRKPARPRRERAKKLDYAAMAAGKGIVMIHSPVASRKRSSAR